MFFALTSLKKKCAIPKNKDYFKMLVYRSTVKQLLESTRMGEEQKLKYRTTV